MELVKSNENYCIFKKRNGRYAVKIQKRWLNGKEKEKVLVAENLIHLTTQRKVSENL